MKSEEVRMKEKRGTGKDEKSRMRTENKDEWRAFSFFSLQ